MTYQVQQIDLSMLIDKNKVKYAKVELLNQNFTILDELQGEVISDDYSVDSASDIRTTYNLTMIVKDSSFNIESYTRFWFDKYVRILTGYMNNRTGGIHWYPMGVFLVSSASYQYNATTHTLTLPCLDLASKLTGDLGGYLNALNTVIIGGIQEDAQIRTTMIDTITQLGNIKNYRVDNIGKSVPYDLEFSVGSTVFDIVRTLRDLYPNWETFFDTDGTFIYQKIPYSNDTPVVIDEETMKRLVISEDTNYDLTQVYNVVEVWGKQLTGTRYSEDVTKSEDSSLINRYTISIPDYTLADKDIIEFKMPETNTKSYTRIQINDGTAMPLARSESDALVYRNELEGGKVYEIQYDQASSKFRFLGSPQVYASAKDTLSTSPFNVDKIGEKRLVLSGGDYDYIWSEDLAKQRAEYELWTHTRLQDTITLEMIWIPWLTVNQKVRYTSFSTGKTNDYIVKNISGSFSSGTMSVTMIRFYPEEME